MLSLASSFTDGVGVCEKLFCANKRKHIKSHAGFKGLHSLEYFVMEPPRLSPLLLLLNSTGSCSHLFAHYYKFANSSPWRRTQRRTHAIGGKTMGCRIRGHLFPLIFARDAQADPCPLRFPYQPHHLPSAGMAPSMAGSKVSSQHWQEMLLVFLRLALHSLGTTSVGCRAT